MQQSVIQGDQDKIIQHEDEVDTGVQGVSVQVPQSVAQVDKNNILHQGIQGDGKSMSGYGLDGVQCEQNKNSADKQ